MYYPSSENKGADQLRGYREADLRLCFRLSRLLVFPSGGSNIFAITGFQTKLVAIFEATDLICLSHTDIDTTSLNINSINGFLSA